MDDRFRSILTLALRPETGDGESQAAVSAARRMVAKQGLDRLLGADAQPKIVERVVKKIVEKPVYFNVPVGSYRQEVTIIISNRFMHSMIEHIFQDAMTIGVKIELLSCNVLNKNLDNQTKIVINVHGSEQRIAAYNKIIDRHCDYSNKHPKTIESIALNLAEVIHSKSNTNWWFWLSCLLFVLLLAHK